MIRFEVDGYYLELSAGFSLQFQKKNILFAFDAIECERSLSFNIPATPTNNNIFKLAKWEAAYGIGMRRRYSAQMQASGVAKYGYLYVSEYDHDKQAYKAIFVTGELFGLLKIKEAGKLADLAAFDETTRYAIQAVPPLPGRATDAWNTVNYNEGGEFMHPSWLISHVVGQATTAAGFPAITLPAAAAGLRVIVGKPALLHPTGVTVSRDVDGNWVDVTQVYPYPRITTAEITGGDGDLSALFPIVQYSAQYRRHWEDYDFQTQQPILRTVVYGGNVEHLQTTQKTKITFARDFPDDVYIGTFKDGGAYTGGFTFYGDRSFGKEWSGGQAVTQRAGDPLAGRTITLEAGTSFVFIRESDLLDYTQYTGDITTIETWEQGWKPIRSAFDVTGVTFEGDGDAQLGDTVRLKDNLPDISLVELLKAVAAATGTALNYTDADGLTFDTLDFDTWSVNELVDVLKIGSMTRTFSDYGQRNIMNYDSDPTVAEGARISIAYDIENDNIEAEKVLQTIPFSEGLAAYDGPVVVVATDAENENDTLADADTTAEKMARVYIPTNAHVQALCDASTALTVQVRASFFEYEQIGAKRVFYFRGCKYVWTEAQYDGKGVVTLKLSKIPA
jgi:hypothetical protein